MRAAGPGAAQPSTPALEIAQAALPIMEGGSV